MLNSINAQAASGSVSLVAGAGPLSPVTLDVWADIACPWCYIGSRRLALALAHEPDGTVLTRWRAFQLFPDIPEGGTPSRPRLAQTFGSTAAVDSAQSQVATIGREMGISFDFRRQVTEPNTALAQQAILLYDGELRQRAVAASLFAAHFERGLDINDLAVIAEQAAAAADDDVEQVRSRLLAGESVGRFEADEIEARVQGVAAVPTYVANGRMYVQGLHEVSALRELIARAR